MSLASDGDSSRVRALSLAAATADVVVVFFGGIASFVATVPVAAASPVVCLVPGAVAGVDSATASFNWAVFCDLMIRASFACWASSRCSTRRASLSPAVLAARAKSTAALRCSSAASSQCILSVCCAALRACACAYRHIRNESLTWDARIEEGSRYSLGRCRPWWRIIGCNDSGMRETAPSEDQQWQVCMS